MSNGKQTKIIPRRHVMHEDLIGRHKSGVDTPTLLLHIDAAK